MFLKTENRTLMSARPRRIHPGPAVAIASTLKAAPAAGISGTRRPSPATAAALTCISGRLPAGVQVFTGCAPGVDQLARSLFPAAAVLEASRFGQSRGSFAARSIACVQAVRAAGGVWLSFPGSYCPPGLAPTSKASQAFSGFGSGTWASLALAAGLGLPCLVFCPTGLSFPSSWGFQFAGQAPATRSGIWYWFPGGAAPGLTQSLL